jgi:hypothetical protein
MRMVRCTHDRSHPFAHCSRGIAISSVHAQAPAANPFVGTWKLIAADKILPDGTRVPDYGTQPHGLAIFTADSYFTVEVFRDVRVKFASNDRAKGTL